MCVQYGSEFENCNPDDELGISNSAVELEFPLNGLRHPPSDGTTGWFVWGGIELSDDSNFFQPIHAKHVTEICPIIWKYLGLAPGWRFLIAPDHQDVWFDQSLLEVN